MFSKLDAGVEVERIGCISMSLAFHFEFNLTGARYLDFNPLF